MFKFKLIFYTLLIAYYCFLISYRYTILKKTYHWESRPNIIASKHQLFTKNHRVNFSYVFPLNIIMAGGAPCYKDFFVLIFAFSPFYVIWTDFCIESPYGDYFDLLSIVVGILGLLISSMIASGTLKLPLFLSSSSDSINTGSLLNFAWSSSCSPSRLLFSIFSNPNIIESLLLPPFTLGSLPCPNESNCFSSTTDSTNSSYCL